MKAKLKELHSPDIDLETFVPDDPKNFWFALEASIGVDGECGADLFVFEVYTPEALADRRASGCLGEVVFGRNIIIVFSYDFRTLKLSLERYCDNCVEDDWEALSAKLSRIGKWEFEDYKE